MNITLTKEEAELVVSTLREKGFLNLYSYSALRMLGASNLMDIADKIEKQIK